MPSEEAMRAAKAILLHDFENVPEDVQTVAEIIDREMNPAPLPWPRDKPCENPLPGNVVTSGWCGNCGWESCRCTRNLRFGVPPVPLRAFENPFPGLVSDELARHLYDHLPEALLLMRKEQEDAKLPHDE